MSFITGAYTLTFDPVGAPASATLGQVQNGVTLSHVVFKQEIRGDSFAQTVQDSVFQGMGVTAAYTLIEANATNAIYAYWPYGSAWLTMSTVIGDLDSNLVGSLLMTVITGTPADTANHFNTITLPRAILAAGFPVDLLHAPALKTVPIRQTIYPDTQGVFGTTT